MTHRLGGLGLEPEAEVIADSNSSKSLKSHLLFELELKLLNRWEGMKKDRCSPLKKNQVRWSEI